MDKTLSHLAAVVESCTAEVQAFKEQMGGPHPARVSWTIRTRGAAAIRGEEIAFWCSEAVKRLRAQRGVEDASDYDVLQDVLADLLDEVGEERDTVCSSDPTRLNAALEYVRGQALEEVSTLFAQLRNQPEEGRPRAPSIWDLPLDPLL